MGPFVKPEPTAHYIQVLNENKKPFSLYFFGYNYLTVFNSLNLIPDRHLPFQSAYQLHRV